MTDFIERNIDTAALRELIEQFPVTAILGARQCGKTTIAQAFKGDHYFDLENPRDLARLEQPQLALEDLRGLVVIDEIQRAPELFALLRYLVDTQPQQKYLILGSASRHLLRQSSESLAGRIAYYHLGGLGLEDVGGDQMKPLWLRGGLPRSYLAASERASCRWRDSYITTFLERDIPQLGINIAAPMLRRFWTMLSHYHGQTMNYAEFARNFGVSDMTVRKYIDILESTFMVRVLQPWHSNTRKRLVKSPKMYLRDSGLFHSLQSIANMEQLLAHNKLGASWEGFAVESACRVIDKNPQEFYFWSTHSGAEVDLFWQDAGKNWAIECKFADAPKSTKSVQSALADLDLEHLWVVYPGKEKYRIAERITALPLAKVRSCCSDFASRATRAPGDSPVWR